MKTQEDKSICSTCKYLKGMFTYTEDGIKPSYICMANDDCWITITELCTNKDFAECEDYESFDRLLTEDVSIRAIKYDNNGEINPTDCTNCAYFLTTPIQFPCGHCMIKTDLNVGSFRFCEHFTTERPKMQLRIEANDMDLQKLYIQRNQLLLKKTTENKRKDNEDNGSN